MGDTMREEIIRAAVAAMPHTSQLVAEDLIGGFTMHTEADDIVAIWQAAHEQGRQLGMEQARREPLTDEQIDQISVPARILGLHRANLKSIRVFARSIARHYGIGNTIAPTTPTTPAGDAVRQCGWIVFSAEIGSGALYNLNQRDAAFDAAKRWGACIQAVELAAGTPNVAAPSSQSAAHGIPTPPAGDSDTQS